MCRTTTSVGNKVIYEFNSPKKTIDGFSKILEIYVDALFSSYISILEGYVLPSDLERFAQTLHSWKFQIQ